jgi:S-adenosylmethionine:tRNA ribosyltransferase-isomerase
MRVEELSYHLPADQIAQRPLGRRDASRLLVMSRARGDWQDRQFPELPGLLCGEELVVVNNARVLPARLFGHRLGTQAERPSQTNAGEPLTGTVQVFLHRQVALDLWEALVRPGRKLPVGERVVFGRGELEAEIISRSELGLRTLRFRTKNALSVVANLERLGHVPLPPYIRRPDDEADRERYQTVYARCVGAVAAPTAGLHFTPEILGRIKARGCELCEITLDVGLGTFQPMHAEILEQHKIHAEAYEISEEAAEKINQAKKEKRPVLAVGTTVVRALEDSAMRQAARQTHSAVCAGRAEAWLFILPGHRFRMVDMLLTNFHLPRSTLLALVAAFAGTEKILMAYRHAVDARYRFYSYGDCMLIR